MVSTYAAMEEDAKENILSISLSLQMSLWAFLFGVLLEWRGLKNLLRGKVRISWLVVPALLLTGFSFIPMFQWISWLGWGNPFFIKMFYIPDLYNLLDVAAGVFLIRSIIREE
ncbi:MULTISPECIES: hypothetical protein [Pontibacillus]|uniref:Lycopene cyclase domain-containing protein n=1 Tax=Pontibacillus chungwhensis TaxID=265426 RepID=A0ABY8V3T5_9BACI|nr:MULTISPECIES: hypothetical protein [Pontibacillus]WIF99509.1 hypothetical protein QNI29_07585 [Pontibacillus chungwhensis]